ncbi:hypothetical protein Ddye_028423 [Dipteronia dyeriana]|uniref:TIR domain-containing protein n=1 Tax=Dipteronia dyeriana TaxID=168575 RepID=A0AAD9TRW8_9ROSI|nr:hypothetical protein Ddye_028423 [Dipteronia dyeriana]
MTPPSIKYDVFLSFRGEDTRNNFTSHLHKALIDKQIETFFDHNINKGDEITPALRKAIEESRISVVIFSEHYASSTWCLDELVHILECMKHYTQKVIPVFHNIDPSVIRNRTGVIADAFKKHEYRYKDSVDQVQRWKDALKEAANLAGFFSSFSKCESEIIQQIVEYILKILNDRSPSDNSNLVGTESKIK